MLEAIVGMDFLPRGEGIVTRRPLELRLVHEPLCKLINTEFFNTIFICFIFFWVLLQHTVSNQSWAMFETRRDKKYTNFEEVRRVIDELTEEVAGN